MDSSLEDIVIVNLDKNVSNQLLDETLHQYKLLYSDNKKIVVTVGKNKIANIPLHGSHGHFVQLIPNDALLLRLDSIQRPEVGSTLSASERTLNIVNKLPSSNIKLNVILENVSEFSEVELDLVDPGSLLNNIKKYSGSAVTL